MRGWLWQTRRSAARKSSESGPQGSRKYTWIVALGSGFFVLYR